MKYYVVILIFALMGCKSRANFELEILTKEINYLSEENDRDYFFGRKDIPKESQTIITYKLTNNTKYSYYFNIQDMDEKFKCDCFMQIDKAFLQFTDSNQKPVRISWRGLEDTHNEYILEYLGYSMYYENTLKNFVIHSGETLYFEYFTVLPYGTFLEDRKFIVDLDKNENYLVQLFLNSDGANYKNNISRTDLKTIEENGYKVFNGTIESKNKVPVVFRSLKK